MTQAFLIPIKRRTTLQRTNPVKPWGLHQSLQLIVVAHREQAVHPRGDSHVQHPLIIAANLKDRKGLTTPSPTALNFSDLCLLSVGLTAGS